MTFLARDSAFGADLVEAANACARECVQHSHGHCQECAEVLSRAAQSAQQMLASFQGGGQQGAHQAPQSQGGQSMGPQVEQRY